MLLLDQLADQHIEQAIKNGELDNLAGAGERLVFEDDSLVPEHLRMAHKILRNAGFTPPDVIDRKSINALSAELERTGDETERRRIVGKLNCLQARLDARSGERASLLLRSDYYDQVLEKLAEGRQPD